MSDVFTRPVVDRSTGKIAIERWQDCEDIVENNKRLQNEPQNNEVFHHLADIPCIILEKWIVEDGISYRELMSPYGFENIVKKKLRDPDWAWLRTTNKRF